jgi:hypothetical protein
MDPQDLLYTNSFASTNIIDDKELQDGTEYYTTFQKDIDKKSNLTKTYINRNLKDGDPININKLESKPWPPSNERNFKPIFSNAVSDIVENKYIKAIRTIISIYSKDRNKSKAIMPNNYVMEMGKQFINIYRIRLIDLNIPNTIPPVNLSNNFIGWVYPTKNLLNYTNTGNSLYPFLNDIANLPPYFWYYSTLTSNNIPPRNALDSIIKNPTDLYTAIIDLGFYSTTTLEQKMEEKMNSVMHNIHEGIVSAYPGNITTRYSPSCRLLRNTLHNFNVNINPYNSVCTIINRAEEVQIIAIQTLPRSTMYSPYYNPPIDGSPYNYDVDIFWNFFYYVQNPHINEIDPNSTINYNYTHTNIMDGKYLFNYKKMADGSVNQSLFKVTDDKKEIPGAEIDGMAPSFIITVKDIGYLFGGINVNSNHTNFSTWTNAQKLTYDQNYYPIIFTNMPSIGGINANFINYIEFYDFYFLNDSNRYSTSSSNYTKLRGVYSFYYHFDNIRIGAEVFKRYAFFIHSNSFLGRPGYYFNHAGFINCKTQETMITSESLYNVLGNRQNCTQATYSKNIYTADYNDCFCNTKAIDSKGAPPNNSINLCYYGEWMNMKNIKNKNKLPMCGRALPFSFKNMLDLEQKKSDIANDPCNGKRDSILSLLGWETVQDGNNKFSEYSPFKFIHRNSDSVNSNIEEYSKIIGNITNNNNMSDNVCSDIVFNFLTIPQQLLNIELVSDNTYVFKSLPFIFLRITFPSLSSDTVSNQLYRTTSDRDTTSNIYEYYYDNPLTNLNDIGPSYQVNPSIYLYEVSDDKEATEVLKHDKEREDAIYTNCGLKTTNYLLKKDADVIFAKINLNSIPNNSYNTKNFDYEFTFYDKPLQAVDKINIELLSPDGKLLNFRQEHNITLEIMEFRDVLKETLFDTRHGEVVTTGIKKV